MIGWMWRQRKSMTVREISGVFEGGVFGCPCYKFSWEPLPRKNPQENWKFYMVMFDILILLPLIF